MRQVYIFKKNPETLEVETENIEDGSYEEHDPFYDSLLERVYNESCQRLTNGVQINKTEYENCWYGDNEMIFNRILEKYISAITKDDNMTWDKRVKQSVMIINTHERPVDGVVETQKVEVVKFDMDEIISFSDLKTNMEPIFEKFAYFVTEKVDEKCIDKVFFKKKNASTYWSEDFLGLKIESEIEIDTQNFYNIYESLSRKEITQLYYFAQSQSADKKVASISSHEFEDFLERENIMLNTDNIDSLTYNISLKQLAKLSFPKTTNIKVGGLTLITSTEVGEIKLCTNGNKKFIKVPVFQGILDELEEEYNLEIEEIND